MTNSTSDIRHTPAVPAVPKKHPRSLLDIWQRRLLPIEYNSSVDVFRFMQNDVIRLFGSHVTPIQSGNVPHTLLTGLWPQ